MIRWGLRILVALAVVTAVAYWLIPGDKLGKQLLAKLSSPPSSAVYSCDMAHLGFPPGLVFDRFRIDFRRGAHAAIKADTLAVRPQAAVLTGRLVVKVRAEAYDGEVEGKVGFIRYFTTRGPLDLRFQTAGLRLEKCAYLQSLVGAPLSGRLNGTFEFSGDTADLPRGSGRAQLAVQGGHFPLAGDLGRMVGSGYFDTLELRAALDRGVLHVEQLVLSGRGVRSEIRGQVILKKAFRDSMLSLSGKLEVAGLSRLKIRFAITGSMAHPAFTVI